jgi:HD-like signal output (HDOD) protein
MKRILFVDDEKMVLDGLRALLRPQRTQWEMVFVGGGAEALAELERAPCDVIVSDMRMPGMDGATLLREVQARHPGVVRIVLSGFAEMEMALRTVPVAHQFLTKPCDALVLENCIDRACRLQTTTGDVAVRRLAAGLQHPPVLPQAYFELTRVLADERSGVADAARVIEEDPELCAKVLQLVNSPFLGLAQRITGIAQATSYLGTNMLKNMSLAVQVFGGSHAESHAQSLWVHRLQRHSLLVGSIARRLLTVNRQLAEDAFIAGILHDIGKFALATEQPHEFAALQASATAKELPLWRFERDLRRATHAELGGHLLATWGLPYPVIEAVANHHVPARTPQKPGLDILTAVYAANILAHEESAAMEGDGHACAPLDLEYLMTLGLADRLPAWREVARSQISAARSANWTGDSGSMAA